MTKVISLRDAPPGWEADPMYEYIGRQGRGHDGYFGNPFRLADPSRRGSTIAAFERYAIERFVADRVYAQRVLGLRDKTLVCFCKPHPCHGDVLARIADGDIVPA